MILQGLKCISHCIPYLVQARQHVLKKLPFTAFEIKHTSDSKQWIPKCKYYMLLGRKIHIVCPTLQ